MLNGYQKYSVLMVSLLSLIICFGLISCSNESKNNPRIYLNTGILEYNRGNYDNAKEYFNLATLALDSLAAEAHFMSGRLYSHNSRYMKAISEFNKALSLSENKSPIYTARGYAYSELEWVDPSDGFYSVKALQDLNRAVEIDSTNSTAFYYRAFLHESVSQSYNFSGDNHKYLEELNYAIRDYSNVIDIEPNFAAPYYFRGKIYCEQEQYELAITDLKNCLELRNNSSGVALQNIYFKLGEALYKNGDAKLGCEYLEKSIENGYWNKKLVEQYCQ